MGPFFTINDVIQLLKYRLQSVSEILYVFSNFVFFRLLLNDNDISRIPALGLFNRLPNLQSLDLSRNNIETIEEGAFEGANSILEM